MIDIRALRDVIGTREALFIDIDGNVVDQGGSVVIGQAGLVAVVVTDAVKVVAEGFVLDSLDRDTLWSVDGFQLGREVLFAIDEAVVTPQGLIDVVVEAGFEWQAISRETGVL